MLKKLVEEMVQAMENEDEKALKALGIQLCGVYDDLLVKAINLQERAVKAQEEQAAALLRIAEHLEVT